MLTLLRVETKRHYRSVYRRTSQRKTAGGNVGVHAQQISAQITPVAYSARRCPFCHTSALQPAPTSSH